MLNKKSIYTMECVKRSMLICCHAACLNMAGPIFISDYSWFQINFENSVKLVLTAHSPSLEIKRLKMSKNPPPPSIDYWYAIDRDRTNPNQFIAYWFNELWIQGKSDINICVSRKLFDERTVKRWSESSVFIFVLHLKILQFYYI